MLCASNRFTTCFLFSTLNIEVFMSGKHLLQSLPSCGTLMAAAAANYDGSSGISMGSSSCTVTSSDKQTYLQLNQQKQCYALNTWAQQHCGVPITNACTIDSTCSDFVAPGSSIVSTSSGSNAGAIAGGVIGGILGAALIAGAAVGLTIYGRSHGWCGSSPKVVDDHSHHDIHVAGDING
jgi:hypothetical protein